MSTILDALRKAHAAQAAGAPEADRPPKKPESSVPEIERVVVPPPPPVVSATPPSFEETVRAELPPSPPPPEVSAADLQSFPDDPPSYLPGEDESGSRSGLLKRAAAVVAVGVLLGLLVGRRFTGGPDGGADDLLSDAALQTAKVEKNTDAVKAPSVPEAETPPRADVATVSTPSADKAASQPPSPPPSNGAQPSAAAKVAPPSAPAPVPAAKPAEGAASGAKDPAPSPSAPLPNSAKSSAAADAKVAADASAKPVEVAKALDAAKASETAKPAENPKKAEGEGARSADDAKSKRAERKARAEQKRRSSEAGDDDGKTPTPPAADSKPPPAPQQSLPASPMGPVAALPKPLPPPSGSAAIAPSALPPGAVPPVAQPASIETPPAVQLPPPPDDAPDLSLLFIQWSADATKRVASLRQNGGGAIYIVREGDMVQGLRVATIRPSGIEIQWRGQSFLLPAARY